jgi:hypothetical protein
MKKVLINISNHPSQEWEEKQREGWDKIIDIAFPSVDPNLSMGEVWELAEQIISEVGERTWEIDVELKHQEPIYIICEGEYSFTLALTEAIRLTGWFVIFAFPTSRRIVLADGRHLFEFEGWRFIHLRCGSFINPRSLILKDGQRLEVFARCGNAYLGKTDEGKLVVIFDDDPLFPELPSILFGEFITLTQLRGGEIFDPINWIPLVSISEDTNGWRVVNRIKETQQLFSKKEEARRYAFEQALREFYFYNISV